MPITYAVDTAHMLVRVTVSNPLTAADVESDYRVSRADPQVSLAMHRLVDMRAISPMPPGADIVRVARGRRGEEPLVPGARIAVLIDSDVAYGVAMQYSAHAGLLEDEFKAFWSEPEVAAWLDRGSPVMAER